ncbi:hypothetical protein [Kocuria palustris]|uniref:hypothetical protein n=1 Tax=Kocuria palustris TaxID=71999 RepID=UPI0011A9D1BE|nr:hypothetical protein [Kocuria palustris]
MQSRPLPTTQPPAGTENDPRSARRPRPARLSIGVLALSLTLAGCSGGSEGAEGRQGAAGQEPADARETAGGQELTGAGDYEFSHGDQELDVHYSNEAADPATARIVVVMHGTGRTADSYRDAFAAEAQGENVIILAPEFDDNAYEGSEDYQGGNLEEGDGDVNEEEDRSFELIEPMVDDVVERVGGEQDSFSIFGHSAGGQFVHRYLAYAPDAPVDAAVAANAGWYMMPDDTIAFPYGTGEAPVDVDTERWVAQDMLVLLGEDDVEQDENLRDTPEAMAQGQTRLERGRSFHEAGEEAAAGGDFGWELRTVPDAGHDKAEMAPEAKDYILSHEQS